MVDRQISYKILLGNCQRLVHQNEVLFIKNAKILSKKKFFQ